MKKVWSFPDFFVIFILNIKFQRYMTKKKTEMPKFYALRKDFNTGKLEKIDVLNILWNDIFTKSGKISKARFRYLTSPEKGWHFEPVTTRGQLKQFLEGKFMNMYWSRCEYEIIACDWPYRDDGLIESARPVKFDVWDQLEANIDVITDLVWNVVKDKIDEPTICK